MSMREFLARKTAQHRERTAMVLRETNSRIAIVRAELAHLEEAGVIGSIGSLQHESLVRSLKDEEIKLESILRAHRLGFNVYTHQG